MMSNFLATLVEWLGNFWPFRTVWQWEVGALYVFGKLKKVLKPGIWPFIPGVMEIKTEEVVPRVFVTPIQSVTTIDGKSVTFSASVVLQVADIDKALNNVVDWQNSALELISAVMAEALAKATIRQLEPDNRAELLRTSRNQVEKELARYGIEVHSIRFNNFMKDMRVYRLFNDQSYVSNG